MTKPYRAPDHRKKIIMALRAAKEERGECRDCKQPVKIKSNGEKATLCTNHAAADAKRKRA